MNQEFGMEDLVVGQDGIAKERRTVVIREVDFQVSEVYENTHELLFYKNIIDPESGDVRVEFERPDIIRIKPTEDNKIRENSMWGKYLTEYFPKMGIRLEKTPKELEGKVFVEERTTISFGPNIETVKWIPVEYLGSYEELY